MLRKIIALISICGPAYSSEYITDAFGIVPSEYLSEYRATWSGLAIKNGVPKTQNAGEPESLHLIVGPKSLAAGREPGHAVVLVLDQAGNPVGRGNHILFKTGRNDLHNAQTRFGLAETFFEAGPKSGNFHVSASSRSRQSERATVRITSDLATVRTAAPVLEGIPTYENITAITTDILEDQFGNTVEDGIGATVLIHHPDNATTFLSPVTRNGKPRVQLLVRDIPDTGEMYMTIGGRTSGTTPLRLNSMNVVGKIDVKLSPIESLNALRARVGPILTDAGHFLSDGAAVALSISGHNGESVSADGWLIDGHFEASLPMDPEGGPFTVTIETFLGRQVTSVEIRKVEHDLRGILK